MPLRSPIATIIKFRGGETAALNIPGVGASADYDPNATTDFVASGQTVTPVVGVYTDGRLAGLDARYSGLFHMEIDDGNWPTGLQPDKATLTLSSSPIAYQVGNLRAREYKGKLVGIDLYLTR